MTNITNDKSTVYSSLRIMMISKILVQLLRWCSTFIVIRILVPEDFAITSLAFALAGFLNTFSTFGLGTAVIQAKDITRSQLEVIFGSIVLLNLFLFSLTWGGASLVANFYNMQELEQVLKVFSFNFLIIMLLSIPNSLMTKEMRFKSLGKIEIFSAAIGAITALYLATHDYGYWTIIFGGMSTTLTKMLLTNIYNPILLKPRFNYNEVKPFLHFGGYLMLSGIVWQIYVSIDVLIAGKFWPSKELGVYVVALQIAVLPLNKILPTIKQVAMPAYSKIQTDKTLTKSYMLKSMTLAMSFAFPVFFGLASVAELLVPLVLGEKWQLAINPFMLLCFMMPMRMLAELYSPAINSIGKPHIVFKNELFILVILVPSFLIGLQWGAIGLAASWLTVFPIITLLISYNYCKVLKINLFRIFIIIIPPIIFSIILFLVVKATIILGSGIFNDITLLTLAIIMGGITYILLMYLDDKKLLREYRQLFFKR